MYNLHEDKGLRERKDDVVVKWEYKLFICEGSNLVANRYFMEKNIT